MPFVFVQPLDLGTPGPAVHVPSARVVGPSAPPTSRVVIRECSKQWTKEQATEEIRRVIVPSTSPDDIPEASVIHAIADTLFREDRRGSFYELLKKGIPVYRADIPAIVTDVLSTANLYGQNFEIDIPVMEEVFSP